MEELAVIPECYVDTCLTETITSANHFNHQKGCGTVCSRMKEKFRDKFALGIVDKDKHKLPYLSEFELIGVKGSIYLHKHKTKSHYIIQISPAIERFILNAAQEKHIKLSDYGFPDDLKKLTKFTKQVTSDNNPKLKILFRHLSDASEFVILSDLIKYIATNRYECDLNDLKKILL